MFPEIANSREMVQAMQADEALRTLRRELLAAAVRYRYSYNFTWFGRPIIQLPDDIMALQELIFAIRPDMIIETGVAHGGSLALSASMLGLLGGKGDVVGVDVEIRPHNRKAIEEHPLSRRITLIEGSSTDESVVQQVRALAADRQKVMVFLDSNHTHAHVRRELQLYSPLVKKGSYVVVFDTAIDDLPAGSFPDRPWGKGNNPKTAVWEFLRSTDRFAVDKDIENRLLLTAAPDGYLKCIKD